MIHTFLMVIVLQDQEAKDLDRQLQAALRSADPAGAVKKSKDALAKGTPDLVRVVLTRLPEFPSRVYFEVLPAFGNLAQGEGLDAVLAEIIRLKEKPHILDVAFMLCRRQGKENPVLLKSLLKDAADPVKIVCLQQVVALEQKDLLPAVIALLETEEKKGAKPTTELLIQCQWALRNLTGLDLGPAASWKAWWDKNGSSFKCPEITGTTSGTVASFVRRSRASQYEELKKAPKSRIIAITTAHSDSLPFEIVLEKMSLPHTAITTKQVVEGTFDHKTTAAMIVNCCPNGPGGKKLHEALRLYVESGGSLLLNGLATEQVVFGAFPGYLKSGGSRYDQKLDLSPPRGRLADPLLRHVLDGALSLQWRVFEEGDSFQPISDRVVVLLESPNAGTKKGTSAPIVGYFRPGKNGGMVAIVACRLTPQGTTEFEPSLQNVVLNFLIEAQENFRSRSGK